MLVDPGSYYWTAASCFGFVVRTGSDWRVGQQLWGEWVHKLTNSLIKRFPNRNKQSKLSSPCTSTRSRSSINYHCCKWANWSVSNPLQFPNIKQANNSSSIYRSHPCGPLNTVPNSSGFNIGSKRNFIKLIFIPPNLLIYKQSPLVKQCDHKVP